MSLYLDAARLLAGPSEHGSLKSRVYGPHSEVRSPAAVYALIKETAKYNALLKEIIDHADVLRYEPKVSPLLALLLVHDLLLAKGGVAASSSHYLRQAIERHKARLSSELTKSRLKRRCTSVQVLKGVLDAETRADPKKAASNVRWVRLNRSSVKEQLKSTFLGYTILQDISEVSKVSPETKVLTIDPNVPGVLGLPSDLDLTRARAYLHGKIILQDKASCFPAYLLLGDCMTPVGDVLDACAAPGNKTSHLAALLSDSSGQSTIYACERSTARSKTLRSMIERAGASNVTILAGQDFLGLDPCDPKFGNLTHLLLDPSCSGSGILRREDVPRLVLPEDPRRGQGNLIGKVRTKRKRQSSAEDIGLTKDATDGEEYEPLVVDATSDLQRLEKLSNLQLQIINHAFQFPSATRVSYSTCSVNVQENEAVVARALRNEQWKLLPRNKQVEGMRRWPHRGAMSVPAMSSTDTAESKEQFVIADLSDEELEACIRCWPGGDECTMGFFTCCFVRVKSSNNKNDQDRDGEWEGFSDHD